MHSTGGNPTDAIPTDKSAPNENSLRSTPSLLDPVEKRPRSAAFDVLRIGAVLGVIAIHVFAELVTNDSIRGSGSWWAAVVADLGSVWAVPVLVMVSGALLLGPQAHRLGPADFYRRRLIRLGPAVIVWHLFYLLVVRLWMGGETLDVERVFLLVSSGEVYTHLYFLWLIVGLYLIAPVLATFLAAGGPRRGVAVASVALRGTLLVFAFSNLAALAGSPRPVYLDILTQWVPYVGYFVLGHALRRVVLGRWSTWLAALVTGLLLCEIVLQYAARPAFPVIQAVLPVSYFGAVVAAVSIGVFLVGSSLLSRMTLSDRSMSVLRSLSAASFGAFLIHFFFIVIARTRLPALVEPLSSSFPAALLAYLVIAAASFGISILALRIPYLRRVF